MSTMMGRAFRRKNAKTSSSRSSGLMRRAIRTKPAQASDLQLPAISRAPMAGISNSLRARLEVYARRCGFPSDSDCRIVDDVATPFPIALGAIAITFAALLTPGAPAGNERAADGAQRRGQALQILRSRD